MTPELIDRDEFIVVGIRVVLDTASPAAKTLWRDGALPRLSTIKTPDARYYGVFSPVPDGRDALRFEYVAGVASTLDHIPEGMVGWVVPQCRYAQIRCAGIAGSFTACRQLATDWLPDSGFILADSPMFAFTDSKSPAEPGAEWTVCIPIETREELEQLKRWQV